MFGLTGFVNGVLRNVERRKLEIELPDLSTKYSMPQWIVEHLANEVGENQVEKVLAALLSTRPVTLRVNTGKISIEEYKKLLIKQGIQVEDGAYLPYALRIQGEFSPEQLPGFEEGYFVAQDESSMLPVALSGIKEGDSVLDVCAAPGGKTMQAAEALNQTGFVIARDVSEYKVSKIKENVARLGLMNVTCEVQDATKQKPEDIKKMDVVIADVPCSGIGIIGKKPDIKYQISKESLVNLVKLQHQILDVVMDYVKPGGILMYSTCTINQKENKENVQYLLDSGKFMLESVRKDIPEMVQIIPGVHESDGFFVARLRRMEEQ
jgi:16S rRNA (cytosine967-C5)-methyltransferase